MNAPLHVRASTPPTAHDWHSLGALADNVAGARDYIVVIRAALASPREIDNETVTSLFTVADDAVTKLGDVMAQLSPDGYGDLAKKPRP